LIYRRDQLIDGFDKPEPVERLTMTTAAKTRGREQTNNT
jgi:hypothetical protein